MSTQNQKIKQTRDLTSSQISMWTGQIISPASPLYNMVYTFDLAGKLDTEHFQKAFQGLVERSDSLRTIFQVLHNKPKQLVLSELEYNLEIIDCHSDKLEKWIENRSKKNLDLSKCTFDSVLLKISDLRYVWYFNEHHLTTDARSSLIIYKKMSELYAKSIENKIEEVSEFPKFQNYVSHESKVSNEPKRKVIDDFWREKTELISEPVKLYGVSNVSPVTDSKRIVIDLGSERSNSLRKLTTEDDLRAFTNDLSLFNIFSTTLLTYLNRVSGQDTLAFGSPVHNRTTQEFKEIPGLFIEFFPFISEVKHDDTYISLFKRVSNKTYDFLRNAQSGASTPNSNRTFNVVLNYINTEFPDFNGIPCEAIWRHPNHSDASHHLRLHIYNDAKSKNLKLYFDLNYAVFDEKMLETAPQHFLRLLDSFIENRHQSIYKTSLLSNQEFQQLVVDQNKSTEVGNKNILELFKAQVQKKPNKIAITDETQSLSFRTLDEKSNQLANFLIANEITDGERVSLYLNRSVDLIIGIIGTLKAGCAYIPIASSNPIERVKNRIKDSQSKIVLTNRKLGGNLENSKHESILVDEDWQQIESYEKSNPEKDISPNGLAYIMFTSGSTGTPKGVKVSHQSLANYINWAGSKYVTNEEITFPLFTTIDFDLTVTSIFTPLTTGNLIKTYEESEIGPDLAILNVIEENQIDIIKLTPTHLELIKDYDLSDSIIKTMIVGGEDFKRDLAVKIYESFNNDLNIFNEYGPTEATVGCILHHFDSKKDIANSVPIGKPIANTQVYILDDKLNPSPQGVVGKLYLSGKSLSDGYWGNKNLTKQKFIANPFVADAKMYDTGDLARLNAKNEIEYLGRKDQQVKIGGIRIELGEIEAELAKHPEINLCVVESIASKKDFNTDSVTNCIRCGLPSNYPTAKFDKNGVCSLCLSFEDYQENAKKYFKTQDDLQHIFDNIKARDEREYDCMMLLSGGKDSSYALAKLVEMGARVLAYTLDNGYISDQAKDNIQRVVKDLKVDHIFGKTPAMNQIFVDSLQRYSNVCNGCFKTIYTLSMKVAHEKKIPYIVTGLSRGQFFETRLTEELFWKDDIEAIDKTILDARKAYHRVDDAVKKLLDTSVFDKDSIFEEVQFLDFYRYFDVELEDLMSYLDKQLPWVRPTDTGRSTNCLINQAGIYVHKKEQGYSNYAFPYSWDVRMGHKTREVSLDEINEYIDEDEVNQILKEIRYRPNEISNDKHLVAYYVSDNKISNEDLKIYLKNLLPDYMIPAHFKLVKSMPLTDNGKVDRKALKNIAGIKETKNTVYVQPKTEFEEIVSENWSEVLQIEKISTQDNFLELGGTSLLAIRIMTRLNDALDLDLPVNKIFEMPTISLLSEHIESTIAEMLEELDT